MPTKPFEPLLYRELRKVEAKKSIEIASSMLQEEINYASNAFQRCQASSTGAADEDLPILLSYLHVIEMVDGIEVLISQSCPNPAIPLLRSAFEASLTINYILEADYRRRAFAWLVCYVHRRLRQYEMLDPSHPSNKEFMANLAADEVSKYVNFPPPPDHAIQNLKSLLSAPNYQVAEAEYQRLRTKRGNRFDWYSLFDGPGSVRGLAICLNRGAQYDILYRYWSTVTHAGDISRFLSPSKGSHLSFKPLRNHEDLRLVSEVASAIIVGATMKMLDKFRTGEKTGFKLWYTREIHQRHLALSR